MKPEPMRPGLMRPGLMRPELTGPALPDLVPWRVADVPFAGVADRAHRPLPAPPRRRVQ